MKWFKTLLFILFIYYFFVSFPDKHIDFWTTVEDGNLSQTFLLSLSLFENTNIKLYFPHLRCERPPSTLVYFTTGLEQAIQEDLKDAFRRQSVQSVLAVKSPLTLKNGQVLGMGKAICETEAA